MDALDLLKSDHDRVRDLFQLARNSTNEQQNFQLIQKLKSEIKVHSQIEEELFYPAFSNYPDFKELLDRSYKEHKIINNGLISLLNGIRPIGQDYDERLNNLSIAFDQHVQAEETIFFQKVRKILKRSERERLGRHIQSFRQSAVAA